MAKSIIQDTRIKECYLCRQQADREGYFGELPRYGLDKHHFMHGTADRKLAEKDGLWAYMCRERHHIYGSEAPHANAEVDLRLKRIAQRTYEAKYGHDAWMKRYGKNYL